MQVHPVAAPIEINPYLAVPRRPILEHIVFAEASSIAVGNGQPWASFLGNFHRCYPIWAST